MPLRIFRAILALSLLTPSLAQAADPKPRIYLALDLSAPWPKSLSPLTANTDTLSLAALDPPLHDLSFAWGALSPSEQHALFMRVGYRFANGSFPEGSVIGANPVSGYALRGVPWLVGIQSAFLATPIKPVVDLEAGFVIANLRYERSDGVTWESGTKWQRSLRIGAGAHLDITDWFGVRLLLGAEWTQALSPEHGPALSMSTVGVTLAGVAKVNPAPKHTDDGTGLRDYGNGDHAGRNNDGYAEIRAGDDAKRRRDLASAEEHYRKGVRLLPRDPQTRTNVEVPVRIDWADILVEIGRAEEAVEVLREAAMIAPNDRRVQVMLEELRRRGYRVEPTAPNQANPQEYYY